MAQVSNPVARALHLRPGEGRTLLVLGSYLLLCTAASTVLSASKNGLFLSVYPGRYIPHVVIGAALLTAGVAVVFSGVIAGTARRRLASWLTASLVFAVLLARWLFAWNPRMSLAVYLLMSVVQVVCLTHAWDFVGDLLTGRQAKRLAPLFGLGASLGAMVGGGSIPGLAVALGTANLLVVGAVLLGVALPLLWAVPEPGKPVDEPAEVGRGAVRSFVRGAARGFRTISSEPLLGLMALSLAGITIAGTLIELQFKLGLQASFDRDRITAVMGVMSSAVGLGTLVLQLVASRWLFPRLGVSFAGAMQGGVLTLAAGGVVVLGGVWMLAAAQAVDDILQFSIQKPVEQVSLLPFPPGVKSAALATLGGVMRPLAKAVAGLLAILLLAHGPLIPVLTTASAAAAFVLLLRHRRLYLDALAHALDRHAVDFTARTDVPLVVDRSALTVIDQGLLDPDPTVVVFSLSLLEQLPVGEAVPRVLRLLDHGTAEVRAEAAQVLAALDLDPTERPLGDVRRRLGTEESGFVRASLLATLGSWGAGQPAVVEPFLRDGDERVRVAAAVALGRSGWPDVDAYLRALLDAGSAPGDRVVGARAAGVLGRTGLLPELAAAVHDDAVRPAALHALTTLGGPAVPVLRALLLLRELPLPLRRGIITALAGVAHMDARDALVELIEEPALGPAALTSLQRLRRDARIDPVAPGRLRAALAHEVETGLRYALVSVQLHAARSRDGRGFLADELEGLAWRSVSRVMRILVLSHDPAIVDAVRAGLSDDDVGARSNALELLEGTLSAETGRVVMPFAEAAAERFSPERVSLLVPDAARTAAEPLARLLDDEDWWARALALHGVGRDAEIGVPGRTPEPQRTEPPMIPLIERVMILKGSQLFRSFPGSDLAGIASLAQDVYFETDDVVFEQGDVGDAFYMVVRGAVRIMRGSHELALLGPREGFGEMAILDQETRSATVTAAEPTTLLKIDRDSFDRLVEQNPSVARGIYRMLTQRLRNTLAQVAAG